MEMSPIFFYLFASLAIVGSLLVVFKKNPVASAFSLILVFFAFAGIYALMQAHLLATLQVLVYAGAIMVLFIFVIMLLNADVPSFDLSKSFLPLRIVGVLGTLLIVGMFAYVFKNTVIPQGDTKEFLNLVDSAGGNTRAISQLMFSEYLLPFELTSLLLLVAIVGVVTLAKRKKAVKG